VLLINAFVAAVVVIAVLYTLAKRIAGEVDLHMLKIETRRLRAEYMERLAALRRGSDPEAPVEMVEIVGEPEAPPANATPAEGMELPAEPARAAA